MLQKISWPLWALRIIALFGLYGALDLSLAQAQTGTACPVIIIPVCYLIACVFADLVFFSFFLHKIWGKLLFNLALSTGLIISTLATFTNLLNISHCPLTSSNIPMCYLAWGSFLGVLGFYILSNLGKNKTSD